MKLMILLVSRKQQKTRKVIETVNNALLSFTEDSSEQHYVDADLTEYSSSSQPVVPEPNSTSSELQSLQKPTDVQPPKLSPSEPADAVDKVDLPEGLM